MNLTSSENKGCRTWRFAKPELPHQGTLRVRFHSKTMRRTFNGLGNSEFEKIDESEYIGAEEVRIYCCVGGVEE